MRKIRQYLHRLAAEQPAVCPYSRLSLRIGGYTAYALLLLAGMIQLIEPYITDPVTAMAYQRAALDNVPAVLLCGVVTAAIGDWLSLRESQ